MHESSLPRNGNGRRRPPSKKDETIRALAVLVVSSHESQNNTYVFAHLLWLYSQPGYGSAVGPALTSVLDTRAAPAFRDAVRAALAEHRAEWDAKQAERDLRIAERLAAAGAP